jgi:hypothetical protein
MAKGIAAIVAMKRASAAAQMGSRVGKISMAMKIRMVEMTPTRAYHQPGTSG